MKSLPANEKVDTGNCQNQIASAANVNELANEPGWPGLY